MLLIVNFSISSLDPSGKRYLVLYLIFSISLGLGKPAKIYIKSIMLSNLFS